MSETLPDWRSRTKLLYGEDGAARIAAGSVVIAGLGAVGSFATEALARSGVGRLVLIDFDAVEASNTNRQLYALSSTVGKRKTDIARERILDINPNCEIAVVPERLGDSESQVASLLDGQGKPDVIVDAIDDIEAKVSLAMYGIVRDIPVVSSMGAARRLDPSLVRTGALKDVNACPLAKCVRKSLRARLADSGRQLAVETLEADRLCCIHSIERPQPQVYVPEFGHRAMGSSICVTGAFGLALASVVLRRLAAERGTGEP